MALSEPRSIYGVHSLTLYDRTTWAPFGILKVLGSVNFDLTGGFNDLYGGSNRYPWDSEAGVVDTTITGTIKEIPSFIFDKFTGGSTTTNAAETSGNVGTITDQKGTSMTNATTGIASATAESGQEGDLKDAIYIFEATGANTVTVYAMSDVDFNQGDDLEFQDDDLTVVAADLTIPDTGGTVSVPNTGIELTGGSGTVALTTGDTAYVYTRKINSGSEIIDVGTALQEFPEFGVVFTSQKKANGDTFEGQMFRCKGIGLPIGLSEAAWLENDITIKALYDSSKQKVGTFRRVYA